MKNKWRVYINPFDADGAYTSYQEVTDDVIFTSLGQLNFELDNTEYDIGIFRVANFKISLKNSSGKYSDVSQEQSIFAYKRSGALVKITWEINEGPICGLETLGDEESELYLSEEQEIFIGLLSDETLSQNMSNNIVTFQVLGRESIFGQTEVNFGSLSNGDTISEALDTILTQTPITNILTVDDANFSLSENVAIDSVAWFENKTVLEAVKKLLLAANSVMYISNGSIFIQPRTAGASVAYEFFGQGAPAGIENIYALTDIKNGLNKTFNYITWQDTTTLSEDTASIGIYGVRKKEIDIEFITDTTKRSTILNSIRDEFNDPKQEFKIKVPINFDTMALALLDRVTVDLPRNYVDNGLDLPICGIAVCGEAICPDPLASFYIPTTDPYKIISKSIDIPGSNITLQLRLI